jgi:hypothetical protein
MLNAWFVWRWNFVSEITFLWHPRSNYRLVQVLFKTEGWNKITQFKFFFSDRNILKHEFPQRSILGTLLFLVYINDLPLRINSITEPVLLADDTSVIISNWHFRDFSATSNLVLSRKIEWSAANKLVLNLEKTNIMKFKQRICHAVHWPLVIKISI